MLPPFQKGMSLHGAPPIFIIIAQPEKMLRHVARKCVLVLTSDCPNT